MMSRLTLLLLCGLLIYACQNESKSNPNKSPQTSTAASSPAAPSNAGLDTSSVRLYAMSGWICTIYKNGSGNIGLGSQVQHFGKFPEGTFSFPSIKQNLLNRAVNVRNVEKNPMGVFFHVKGTTKHSPFYLEDLAYSNPVFEKAYQTALESNNPSETIMRLKSKHIEVPF